MPSSNLSSTDILIREDSAWSKISADREQIFYALKTRILDHLKAQQEKLQALQKALQNENSNLQSEVQSCITEYQKAYSDIKGRTFEESYLANSIKGTGVALTALGAGIGAISLGVGVLVAMSFCLLGSAVMGAGSITEAMTDKTSQDAMMRPVLKAENRAVALIDKVSKDSKLRGVKVNEQPVSKLRTEFKTESKNFKKRMALFAFGALCTAGAIICVGLVASSHGVLAPLIPVAKHLALMGGSHMTHALTAAAGSKMKVAGLAGAGIASFGTACLFPSKRVVLQKNNTGDNNSQQQTPPRKNH